DVREGDFLVFPKPRPEPHSAVFPLDLARLAGFYLADGSASLFNGYKGLQFSFNIDDVEAIDEVREVAKNLYDTEGSVTWIEEKNEAHVVVYTKAGYEAMKTHVGTGSHTKRLSKEFMAQDETFLRELVRTYVLGDGSVTYRGGDAWWHRAHTTSRVWAHQLQAILARLGTYATIRLERQGGPAEILGRKVVRRDLYTVQWTEGRRLGEVRDAGGYFLVPIKSIGTEEFEGFVHNLDVESPDSYLASGFAVHNCSAPIYSGDSLHSAVVEIIVKDHARARYTTIQNWSNNVYNLVTKRARADEGAVMEWVDANLGSKVTMKYPSIYLMGKGARGDILSVAYAGEGQHQDAGGKVIHVAPHTRSNIVSKSISKDGGHAGYRGHVRIDH
ncbi:MAG: SufD family Fe-S cluster assembly protein, partial [Acidimicrobiia bacterium]